MENRLGRHIRGHKNGRGFVMTSFISRRSLLHLSTIFSPGFVLKARYDFGEFERSKQTIIVFEVNDDEIVRGQ